MESSGECMSKDADLRALGGGSHTPVGIGEGQNHRYGVGIEWERVRCGVV